MNTKNNIIAVVAVIALVVSIWAKVTPATAIVQNPFGAVSNTNAPAANTVLVNGVLLPNPSVLDYFVARTFLYTDKALGFGNASGVPVLEQVSRVAMASPNNVPCSLQSPYTTASSSVQDISFTVTVGTSTTALFAVGTSTTATATTSNIGTATVAANTQATATFTLTAGNNIIAPGGFVNFGAQGGPSTGFAYTGSCKALFVSTN